MAIKRESIPDAATLIYSMRAIGYDFESAVADIIDNSISAGAQNIEISFPTNHQGGIYLQIIDNGSGMSKSELFEAMRFGSVKVEERSKSDLGRFGLGLKTASISQCKKLTVISKQHNNINGFVWDLDLLLLERSWEVYELSIEEISERINQTNSELLNGNFTIVIWENLDMLENDVTKTDDKYSVFMRKINQMDKHLSLVFHRFIGEGLVITLNGSKIVALDPFLSKHNKTLIKPEQVINTKTKDNKNEKVKMQVFVLPYFKDMDSQDYEKVGGKEGLEEQGFYIYRNKRLLIHGTWFKIKPKAELLRNARIRIDIPNTLDNMWSIDIKKQTAIIPSSLLAQLKSEVSEAVNIARKLHDYKGQIQTKDGSIWKKIVNPRENSVFYEINKESDLIKKMFDDFDEKDQNNLLKIFNLIELSLPYKDIYNAVSEKKGINVVDAYKEDQLLLQAYKMFEDTKKTRNLSNEEIVSFICLYEPFLSSKIKDRLMDKINGY